MRSCFVAACMALYLFGCTGVPVPPSSDVAAFTTSLENQVPAWMEQYRVPGLSIALVYGGEVIWAKGFGLADVDSATPVTSDTIFQVASVSKPVSAWGVMRLVEQNRLALDMPVDPLLTRWHFPPSSYEAKGVTVERLLSHTAGLSLPGYIGFAPDQKLPSLEQSLSGDTNGMGSLQIVREPGSAYNYSGGGYTVLQLLIEEISGQSFSDFMQTEILQPLDMTTSSYTSAPDFPVTTAYGKSGDILPNYVFTELAAAGLYSTAPDMGRFVAANMSGPNGEPAGRGILSPEALAEMFSPMPNTDGHQGLGFALGILPDGTPFVHHNGSNRGWKSYIAAIPERGQGLVTLTNSDLGDDLNQRVNCAWLGWVTGSTPLECQLDTLLPIVAAAILILLIVVAFIAYRLLRHRRTTKVSVTTSI
jgi:CubicO group peptidase (beta-lactamase class C family)